MNNKFKCKISFRDITYGPKKETVEEPLAWMLAGELMEKGYRKVSNAYCRIARIEREDWVQELAKKLNCAPADFYKLDGSGISDRWRDHYVRSHSQDVLVVHPDILKHMKSY
jgi:hypothetical protein